MDHDPSSLRSYPHPSSRATVLATDGVVATSQPLAAQAGLGVLVDGGTAIDAAIAAAAALTVVEPCSNGLGSDAFALVWADGHLYGLNGSGRWPAANDAAELRAAGHRRMPERGWVPGDRTGRSRQLVGAAPTVRATADRAAVGTGHPLCRARPSGGAGGVTAVGRRLRLLPEPGTGGVGRLGDRLRPRGRAPRAGERWVAPGHARGLRCLAANGLRDFYEGEVAQAIVDYAATTGGRLSADDLAGHSAEWVDPIGVDYGGHRVWEIPPNGQGIAALMALGMVANTDAASHPQLDAANWHYQIEAMKLAFADNDGYVADQAHAAVPVEEMIDDDYLKARASLIGERAGPAPMGEPRRGGTVYLCTADRDGMMVSFIQSNYMGFGSGVVVPSHGISLQNRGAGFVLDAEHPNVAAPGKRPRHTIIPGFLTRDDKPVGPFGVMGGEMQPQGHLQVVSGMVDHGLNPQAALDAPRWQVERNGVVRVESQTPADVIEGLRDRGHEVIVERSRMSFGRGQIIVRADDGVYAAGSEPRADGCAVGI